MDSSHQRILDLTARRGLLRPRDLDPEAWPRVALMRLLRQGLLERVSRGLYALPHRQVSELTTLAEVARRHLHGIVCLLSRCVFITSPPRHLRIMAGNSEQGARPKPDYPPLRIVLFIGTLLEEGIEKHEVDGATVRVTSLARTVADCFNSATR